ncbi:RagB/SusD family nutrient uptake outer membrane protein [Chitinophaga solisilvae]|uniref:RagB/SusD family nutrient uptake outer membrane protein n=1 Tax=Chitinophaga solisilvae TaxID=1233460 RepID=UPI0013721A25|nr:RagB/SusD family nutrient uptake outer membrane protein [Chitinophaga solisilvae]
MKKIQIILLTVLGMGIFSSCLKKNLLDPVINTNLNEASVFADSARTMDYLIGGIYTDLGINNYFRRYSSNGLAECADESSFKLFGGTQNSVMVILGTLNPDATGPYEVAYNSSYDNIRRVNIFLKNLPNTPLSGELKVRVKAEARFLRAWFYAQLLMHFGGMPIVGDTIYAPTQRIIHERATIEQMVQYIVSELDAARPDLPDPVSERSEDYGRANQGFCMALKAKILLYAASPLMNGGNAQYPPKGDPAAKYVSAPVYRPERWQAAETALSALINTGWYSLVVDNSKPGLGFYKLFITRKNSEYIIAAMTDKNRSMERQVMPPSRNGNSNSLPVHNLVKDFGTNEGKSIDDPTSGYNPENPFVNRDPRFGYTFIYNGAPWLNRVTNKKDAPVWTYYNAPSDGYNTALFHTGYFFRKMCHESADGTGGTNPERVLPLIRYADILLMHAEAVNESQAAGENSPAPQLAYTRLMEIRERAGIRPGNPVLYGLKAGMTKAEMRKAIQLERRVELAYEDARFFDVRRWMIAMETQNVTLTALKMTPTGSSTYKYEVVPITYNARHNFRLPMHYFPLPMVETGRNTAMLQNPGY